MPDHISPEFAKDILAQNQGKPPEIEILEAFPYPIHIYDAKGTSVMVNRAFLEAYDIPSSESIIGRYNLFSDSMLDVGGIREEVMRAFEGTPIFLKDNKVPVEYIRSYHHIQNGDSKTMYQDITAFPLFDAEGQVKYVVVMMITQRLYNGKSEINRAKEYIQNHCEEKFNLNKVACVAGFSPAYFARIFHTSTGMTPHDYYIKNKVEKIKIKLMDYELSVAEAFAACGVEYNGHYARVFRLITNMTPTQFRQKNRK